MKPVMVPVASEACQRRDACRLCGSHHLVEVLSLTPTPPANAFVDAGAVSEEQAAFPLDVFMCEDCAHVQLLDVVDPAVLFENYVYVSGTSPVFIKHFENYAQSVCDRLQMEADSLVVDIGSNDGTLLGFFQVAGHQVLGIDPARDIARDASARGIETWPEFFNRELVGRIREKYGSASVITANNVFAHADDLAGMAEGIRALLSDDGVFVFEVSYLVDIYEQTLFDTIYHEHLAYHTVNPLRRFFAAAGMELIAAERIDTHGGSLRGTAQLANGPHAVDPSVDELIALEESLGLDQPETLKAFGGQIERVKHDLMALLSQLKSDGKSIAGFGAPAKATTLMYHFGIGPEAIDFIVDDSPLKQGLYSPGLHIPVLSSDAIEEHQPDYLLILAWNFAEPIIAKNQIFRDRGGKFILPLPEVAVR